MKSRRFLSPLLASDGGAGGWRAGKAPRLLPLPLWNQGMVQKVAHPALDVVGVPAEEQAAREGRVEENQKAEGPDRPEEPAACQAWDLESPSEGIGRRSAQPGRKDGVSGRKVPRGEVLEELGMAEEGVTGSVWAPSERRRVLPREGGYVKDPPTW